MSIPRSSGYRSSSRLSRILHSQQSTAPEDTSEYEATPSEDSARVDIRSHGSLRPRTESSPLGASFSSSLNQRTPVRSYYQRSYQGSLDAAQHSSQAVREDTAELASLALSDATSNRSGTPPNRHINFASNSISGPLDTYFDDPAVQEGSVDESASTSHRSIILEVSEPVSPESKPPSRHSPTVSVLTELIRGSPQTERGSIHTGDDGLHHNSDIQAVTVRNGIISQPHERTPLLNGKGGQTPGISDSYNTLRDIESQERTREGPIAGILESISWSNERLSDIGKSIISPKTWNPEAIWRVGVVKPAGFLPAVVLGLLLNVLDALSYGMILFPLGQPIFASLGPDGISMFYVSCIVSQLVYSLGGSIFKGGIGSEMIEVVPFFHKMAFTILAQVGEDSPKSVLATTILSYSISSVLTGAVFYLMGKFKLGSLIGFFPRHILLGCIGGVGWFLFATGVEVTAGLKGNLEYNIPTLKQLAQIDTIFQWTVPLVLAILLVIARRWVKHPLTDAGYFISIIAIFYFFVAALQDLHLDDLRARGWVFDAPEAGVPFYHFYTLFDFSAVNWGALGSTVPAMFALTFFGILHVPINIPALGLSTGEDNVDVDRELRAHGLSNALSGLCGSIQNYLVYTNSVLFMRSGGDSRVAGVLLAFATFGILVIGPRIIGYIPKTVVGALIFYLSIDLLHEALIPPWNRVHRLEYLTIVIIVITMGTWDFVIGILIGILLACVNFVVQTSRISAIRGIIRNGIANSTIYVLKLAGYLFFGTIVGVEKKIRALLLDDSFHSQPIQFLVLDLSKVDGVDFSAAEAFTRINRILSVRNVKMIMCGIILGSNVRKSLDNVGLFNKDDGIEFFEDLNSALESCENELLKAFYQQRDALINGIPSCKYLDVPQQNPPTNTSETMFSSPRTNQLKDVATTTLQEQHNTASHTKWQQYRQPLQLMLQTFWNVSDKDEDFWSRATPFFKRHQFAAGTVLYERDDRPDGFYLLESGLLKAEYRLDEAKFSELIVAGTTCGELPFFSNTNRSSTTSAETESVTWTLNEEYWASLQTTQPDIAHELLKISLKLTSERMDTITKYILLNSG